MDNVLLLILVLLWFLFLHETIYALRNPLRLPGGRFRYLPVVAGLILLAACSYCIYALYLSSVTDMVLLAAGGYCVYAFVTGAT